MTYEEAKMQIQAIPEKIWDQLSEPDREAMEMAFSALQALGEIYAFIMKSEASETTDGVLEIFDALEAQEAKTQLSAEGTTSDLISRQDAIEVIEEMQMPIMRSMFPEEQFVFKGMSEALSAIKDLPSAHPEIEERKEESAQNVPKEDLISRKAAIDAICDNCDTVEASCPHYPCGRYVAIEKLPSAQPEPLVKESRTLVKDLVKDTISRTAAIDALGERPIVWTDDDQYALGERNQYDIDRLAIETLPSGQPEIIHCRECQHHRRDNTGCYYCVRKEYGYGWGLNDFCSDAERRTDDLQ